MLKFLYSQEINKNDWISLLERNPHNNIFQTPEFYTVNNIGSSSKSFVYGIEEDGSIVGLVSGVILQNGYDFVKRFSTRAIIVGAPILDTNISNKGEVLDFFLKNIKYELNLNNVIYIQFRNLWSFDDYKQIFVDNGFILEDHLDIIMDLTLSESELWNRMTKDRKKSIKKGQRELQVRFIEDVEDNFDSIYNLLDIVYKRIKLPLPSKEFFNQAIKTFLPIKKINIFGAFKNDVLIGVRLVLCYNKLIYDWYAGADDNYLEYRPNDILIWEVLMWGKKNGYNTFDFGGAGKPNVPYGVRDYKLKFGGEIVSFGRFQYINNSFLYNLGLIGLTFYKLTKKIIK